MKYIRICLLFCLAFSLKSLQAQQIKFSENTLQPFQVYSSLEKVEGKAALRVVKDSTIKAVDEPTFVKVKGVDFKDGTIEVKVLSRRLKNAPQLSRGFIGLAFRINTDNSKYESIYLRPANAREDDQVRRNHSIQYYSYPDYKFNRLRKESPEVYESYSDMALNEWITMKVVVSGKKAKLFLNGSNQPSLIVNDLKLGPDASGAIGLWVDVGTEGYFADLKVTANK